MHAISFYTYCAFVFFKENMVAVLALIDYFKLFKIITVIII